MKSLAILGSTGTIGTNTLNVLSRHRDRFRVAALTANTDVEAMALQCAEWQPQYAVMADAAAAERLAAVLARTGIETEVLSGTAELVRIASLAEVDQVMAGIVGAAGLLPSLAAATAGKRVLLANKEALVMSGRLFMDAVRNSGAELLPIDSEHNAIFQCLPVDFARGLERSGVRRILLTASGGPFRDRPLSELSTVTPEQACAHPNWVMGRKISVDSATMMNKGLEVIEACWLFGTNAEKIRIVLHPQSVIHSMVEYNDGSVLSQMGNPDMRTPIAHALAWPGRIDSGVASLDPVAVGRLEFEDADVSRFPCLRLAYEAAEAGGTATAILNAANEEAVAAFLDRRLSFTDIPAVIETTLADQSARPSASVDVILEDDAAARDRARSTIASISRGGE